MHGRARIAVTARTCAQQSIRAEYCFALSATVDERIQLTDLGQRCALGYGRWLQSSGLELRRNCGKQPRGFCNRERTRIYPEETQTTVVTIQQIKAYSPRSNGRDNDVSRQLSRARLHSTASEENSKRPVLCAGWNPASNHRSRFRRGVS
jgi:hypothetical protein